MPPSQKRLLQMAVTATNHALWPTNVSISLQTIHCYRQPLQTAVAAPTLCAMSQLTDTNTRSTAFSSTNINYITTSVKLNIAKYRPTIKIGVP